jgi:hypothetical protein
MHDLLIPVLVIIGALARSIRPVTLCFFDLHTGLHVAYSSTVQLYVFVMAEEQRIIYLELEDALRIRYLMPATSPRVADAER